MSNQNLHHGVTFKHSSTTNFYNPDVSHCFYIVDVCLKDVTAVPSATSEKQTTTTTTTTTTTMRPITTTRALPLTLSTTRVTKLAPLAVVTTKKSVSTTTLPATTSTDKVTTKTAQASNQNNVTVSKTSEAPKEKDYDEVANNVEGEDEHDMEQDDMPPPTATTFESDNIVNEKFMMKTAESDAVDVSFIIKASVMAISTVFLSFFIFFIVYKQYKKSTNPLNYKEKQENGSRKANEEFSEIRFLTSDETLDFNLASAENATEL